MPSRRTLLASAGALGTSAIAGCSGFGGSSLPWAHRGDDPRLPEDATVVAGDDGLIDAAPHGHFRQQSGALEHAGRLSLVTRHQLIPGTNQFGSDWRIDRFTVTHDFGPVAPAGPVETDASYVQPPSEPESRTGIRLGVDHDQARNRWTVSYDPASDATWGPTFLTSLAPGPAPGPGDRLASTRLTVRTRAGPFSRDSREASVTLVHQ